MTHKQTEIQLWTTNTDETLQWLLSSTEPWTRYRTLMDLLGYPLEDSKARAARQAMVAHPQVQELVAAAGAWGERSLKRHNDAAHPLYALSTLADFGLDNDDPGIASLLDAALAHQSDEGAFQSLLNIGAAYGGTGADAWAWLLCDAPTVLYCLLAMGKSEDLRVQKAVDHLADQVDENGWRCRCAPELGKFRGPGRKDDPCPIANVYALKALSLVPAYLDSSATRQGVEMLLHHWERRGDVKHYLFGIGSDFRKLKYPFIWYDILHVMDVLSRFPFTCNDPRLADMLDTLVNQANEQGRFRAGSLYQAWKGWSFADKKQPSPWLTLLVTRIRKRVSQQLTTDSATGSY